MALVLGVMAASIFEGSMQLVFGSESTKTAVAPATQMASAVAKKVLVVVMHSSLGPVVGGLLVTASWRWVFLVNVPIGLAALVFGWLRLPEVPGHRGPRPDA